VARVAVQTQLARATRALQDLHRNMPYRLLRLASPLLLAGSRGIVLPGDTRLLEMARALQQDQQLVQALCPDVGVPKSGGLKDLIQALELSRPLAGELEALNKVLRRTRSLEQAAGLQPIPRRRWPTCVLRTG
jgi:acyl-CoA dehydrogenase